METPGTEKKALSTVTNDGIAARFVRDGHVERVEPGVYVIKENPDFMRRIVTLVPKTYSRVKCECNAEPSCPHVVACQIYLGTFDFGKKAPKNSTLYLKRIKSKADKTSGRKKPRKKDVDEKPSKCSKVYDGFHVLLIIIFNATNFYIRSFRAIRAQNEIISQTKGGKWY